MTADYRTRDRPALRQARNAGAVAAIAALTLVSCVSERTTGTTVDAAACNLQLPSDAFGSAVVIIRDFTFIPAQVHVRRSGRRCCITHGA